MIIKILTLKGCSRCAKIKSELSANKINFLDIPCGSDNRECDETEEFIRSNLYPIVKILNNNGLTEIIYLVEDYERLRIGMIMNKNIKTIPVHSIDGIVNYIKNKLN